MVKPHGDVDPVHRVHRKVIGASLDIEANAIEHGIEMLLLFLTQGATKALFPGLQFLLDQVSKRGNGSTHGYLPTPETAPQARGIVNGETKRFPAAQARRFIIYDSPFLGTAKQAAEKRFPAVILIPLCRRRISLCAFSWKNEILHLPAQAGRPAGRDSSE